jgi:hypothetical protein
MASPSICSDQVGATALQNAPQRILYGHHLQTAGDGLANDSGNTPSLTAALYLSNNVTAACSLLLAAYRVNLDPYRGAVEWNEHRIVRPPP